MDSVQITYEAKLAHYIEIQKLIGMTLPVKGLSRVTNRQYKKLARKLLRRLVDRIESSMRGERTPSWYQMTTVDEIHVFFMNLQKDHPAAFTKLQTSARGAWKLVRDRF